MPESALKSSSSSEDRAGRLCASTSEATPGYPEEPYGTSGPWYQLTLAPPCRKRCASGTRPLSIHRFASAPGPLSAREEDGKRNSTPTVGSSGVRLTLRMAASKWPCGAVSEKKVQ